MRLLYFILTLGQIVILLLLAGIYLNSKISPAVLPFVNLLSLSFAPLMLLYLLLCLFWIVLWKKRGLLFLVGCVLFWTPLRAWTNFTGSPESEADLKIVSMNIKGGTMGREKIYEYLAASGADVILAQEYGEEFNIPGYIHRTNTYEITALNSKTEILKQEKIATLGNGNSFYVDIRHKGTVIRFVNVYLNPFSFEKQKMKPGDNLEKNQVKLKYILHRLLPVFKIHQKEIADIRRAIEASPYPVILCGDFNAVPFSYEYYTLGKGLTDAFVAAGNGSGTSFHDYKFPLRIDYIFASPEIVPVSYKVDRSVHLSDHFPVIAEFQTK